MRLISAACSGEVSIILFVFLSGPIGKEECRRYIFRRLKCRITVAGKPLA